MIKAASVGDHQGVIDGSKELGFLTGFESKASQIVIKHIHCNICNLVHSVLCKFKGSKAFSIQKHLAKLEYFSLSLFTEMILLGTKNCQSALKLHINQLRIFYCLSASFFPLFTFFGEHSMQELLYNINVSTDAVQLMLTFLSEIRFC